MLNIKNNKGFSIILLIFLMYKMLFAESVFDENLTQKLDEAFEIQSKENIVQILQDYKGTSEYSFVESYTLQKTRKAFIFNELYFAKDISLEIITNNLDNFDAVDLYSLINKAIVKYENSAKIQEKLNIEKKEEELAQAAKVKTQLDKEYNMLTNETTGDEVYLTLPEDLRYSSFCWNAELELIDLSYISTPDINNFKYGLGVGGKLIHYSDTVAIGSEFNFDTFILSIMGGDSIVSTLSIIPEFSFPKFNDYIFFRAGFTYLTSDPLADGTATADFLSPVLGIGLFDVPVGSAKVNTSIDYLAGGFMNDTVNNAFAVKCKLYTPLTKVGKINIGLNSKIANTLLMVSDGIENRTEISFSIGVRNCE